MTKRFKRIQQETNSKKNWINFCEEIDTMLWMSVLFIAAIGDGEFNGIAGLSADFYEHLV